MIFDKNSKLSIIKIAVITSAILAILIISPLYFINVPNTNQFLTLWVNLFIRFMFVWMLEYILLTNFDNKLLIQSWFRVIITSFVILLLDYFISMFTGDIYPVNTMNKTQLFLGRFIHISIFSILTNSIFQIILSKDNELKTQVEISELKFKNLEAEYYLLKSQINPHFIFNALNISKSLVKDKPEEAENYIIQLSDFIRSSIPYDKKSATLDEEIDILNKYIELQKVRFGDSINITVDCSEKYKRYQLPFFTLITLIENAFKHNILSLDNPLKIYIYCQDNYLFIENNIQLKKNVVSTNTGLKNLNSRAKILSNEELEVKNDGKLFIVKIKMLEP